MSRNVPDESMSVCVMADATLIDELSCLVAKTLNCEGSSRDPLHKKDRSKDEKTYPARSAFDRECRIRIEATCSVSRGRFHHRLLFRLRNVQSAKVTARIAYSATTHTSGVLIHSHFGQDDKSGS